MKFIRLQIHSDDGDSSEPYLFCSKCRSFIMNGQFRFCPWCGHHFLNNPVELIDVDQSELSENGINFRNIVDFVKERAKWE